MIPKRYNKEYKGVKLDPYRMATILEMPVAIFQAFKKMVRRGKGHKSEEEDIQEAIDALNRHLEMMREDR